MSELAEGILVHVLTVLNLYTHLVKETPLSSVSESSMNSNTFLPILSPSKKLDKKSEEKGEDKKSKNSVTYKHTTQYVKLEQLLKNAHTNYKVSTRWHRLNDLRRLVF